jgi:hypothetical protein
MRGMLKVGLALALLAGVVGGSASAQGQHFYRVSSSTTTVITAIALKESIHQFFCLISRATTLTLFLTTKKLMQRRMSNMLLNRTSEPATLQETSSLDG